MKQQTFSLHPFPTEKDLPNIKITGNISREDNQLTINYQLTGDLEQIAIPTLADTPIRKDELWQDTCFEFFIGVNNFQHYWECNLSPAGHWNIYSFNSYRQGMQTETAFNSLPLIVENQSDSFILSLNFDLDKIISHEQTIEIAVTTVIKQHNHHVTYWALTHQGTQADFHLRDSFIIEL